MVHELCVPITAVGFDLDNTLYVETPDMRRATQDRIRALTAERLRRHHDASFVEDYASALEASDGSSSQAIRALGIPHDDAVPIIRQACLETDITHLLERDERLAALFQRIHASRDGSEGEERTYNHMFLITGSDEGLARRKLHALGLGHEWMDAAIFAGGPARVGGHAFCHIASELGNVPIANMLYVGDEEGKEIKPARETGLATAIVNYKEMSPPPTIHLMNVYDLETHLF